MRNGAGIRAPLLWDNPQGGWRNAAVSSGHVACLALPWPLAKPPCISSRRGHRRLKLPRDGNGSRRVSHRGHQFSAGRLGWGIGSRCPRHKDPIIVSALVLRVLCHSPMGTLQSHAGKAVQIHRGKGSKTESPVPSRVGALWHLGGGCKGYEGPEVPTRCLCSRPSGHSVLRTPGQFPLHLQITLRIRQ